MTRKNPYYKKDSNDFRDYIELLKIQKKHIAVVGHIRPDGDSLGSVVALVRTLNNIGLESIGVINDDIPKKLITFVKDTPFINIKDLVPENYHIISVDCADYKRLGFQVCNAFKKVFLNIDHHITNKIYAEHNIIKEKSSATAEILAGIFLDLDFKIDKITAEALYLGIVTDTGNFCFPSTNINTFKIIQNLIQFGASSNDVTSRLYNNESYSRIKLIQKFLKSLEFKLSNRVCIGYLTKDDFRESGAGIDESEGLVDYPRSIKGVDIGVLIEHRDEMLKISLRAKEGRFRVDEIAKAFGGGGHSCASGVNYKGDILDFKDKLINEIENKLNLLHD